MTAVILCPGPSLADLRERPDADLVIGVNRAATAFACDVWAASDYTMIRDYLAKVIGEPGLLTKRQTWRDIGHRIDIPLANLVEEISFNCPNWQNKTMTCAMVYAHSVGADSIDIYGCDWAGKHDFDGLSAGENRSDARWTQEAADYAALVEALANHSVIVHRFLRIRHGE